MLREWDIVNIWELSYWGQWTGVACAGDREARQGLSRSGDDHDPIHGRVTYPRAREMAWGIRGKLRDPYPWVSGKLQGVSEGKKENLVILFTRTVDSG